MKKKSEQKSTKKVLNNSVNTGISNYSAGDFLIRIKNTCMSGKKTVSTRKTKLIENLAKALKNAGFLDAVEVAENKITVQITYKNKKPLIMDIQLVSKPGLRVYKSYEALESIKSPSTFIVTTSKGIMTAKDAVKNRVGGEIIAEIL